MVAFSDLYTRPTLSNLKAAALAIAGAAGLKATTWIFGDPSERWIEILARACNLFEPQVTQAIRGYFLDLATDPGDVDAFGNPDPALDQTPRPGFLSAWGEGQYGTTRGGQTRSTTTLTVTNADTSPATFAPFDLTFTTGGTGGAGPKSDGGRPTYRNTADPSVYTNLDGTVTIAPFASKTLPIQCEQAGSYGSSASGKIDTVVTGSFGTLTCTNAQPAIGQDREDAALYRARCRVAMNKLAPGGPGAAYEYAANTARDGTPLQRADGQGPVSITRTFASKASSTGVVNVYFADADGPADASSNGDVDSANANIQGVPLGVITDPLGVVPDCVTYTGAAATATSVHVSGSCRIKATPGGLSGTALQTAVKQAIVDKLAAEFAKIPIGAMDQDVSGNGTLYTSDIAGMVRDAYAGIYDVSLANPSTDTAVLTGHVATVNSTTSDWAVTVT